MNTRLKLFAVLLLGAAFLTGARANPLFRDGELEMTVLGGVGFGRIHNVRGTPLSLTQTVLRAGTSGRARGSGFLRGNASLMVEIVPLLAIDQTPHASGGGVTFLYRYTLQGRRIRPLAWAGLGFLWTEVKVPPGESDFNFTPQAGVGFQYFVKEDRALDLELRFHHISNNGMTARNPGINSLMLMAGYSLFR